MHWESVNGKINKAHVIPNLNTHGGPNPLENDIPNVDGPVKRAIIAAGADSS